MRRILLFGIVIWLLPVCCLAQQGIYQTAKGTVVFFSKAPLEDITAENKAAISLINTVNNEIVVRVTISRFDFPNKLMQEHFNENYLESDKHPTATFKGKINEAIPWDTPGSYPASASGVLHIHGKSVNRTIKGTITVGNQEIGLDSKFQVPLADHDIQIPTIVFNKIAEVLDVRCQFQYRPYKKK
ncbi:YceI family protein [Pontibacter roseus]|uniref:YceI family protein n=1 Tax=Pontibacter roseus TaxID=336989 RepID=UPI00036BD13A|nr:YceI family protein [Pontibacter roseus]